MQEMRSIPPNSPVLARHVRKPCSRLELRRQWSRLLSGLGRFVSAYLLLLPANGSNDEVATAVVAFSSSLLLLGVR